ncbi:MAG: helix-turn-helix domain-containing protein [Pseudonocardiaceae bacterium]|nr:helix-turn-helix domain-containing protein [Pseudonocardiaceae bacterium]
MSNAVHQAREVLGHRLRDIRRDAGLTGRQLATLASWHSSKVSKIEYGKQTPSEDDIRVWCRHCGAPEQIPDLIATVRNVEAMYIEWRRMLRVGTKRRQEASISLESQTGRFRWYEPVLVPGILQTAEYAAAVLARVIDFYGIPDDVDAGVAARMERQQALYRGNHRFHFILAQQALLTTVGDTAVMIGQLDRLLTVLSLPRVRLGVVPALTTYRAPTNQFIMFDSRTVHVETVSAELKITQPREIALYARTFEELSELAVYDQAHELIATRLTALRADLP